MCEGLGTHNRVFLVFLHRKYLPDPSITKIGLCPEIETSESLQQQEGRMGRFWDLRVD